MLIRTQPVTVPSQHHILLVWFSFLRPFPHPFPSACSALFSVSLSAILNSRKEVFICTRSIVLLQSPKI
nr:MAG TPA: hypothetical protein [Caudoviricetes sp.]